jgi:6-pyruvoyltetrahydropterin/6-carboxytetrahydropterin synthase
MRYSAFSGETEMVQVTRSYEFCAAHRLSVEGLTEEENRRTFGKCSNPHGHGHNYTLAVTVQGMVDKLKGTVMDVPGLDGIVMTEIIERFDHKNLNVECPDFRGVNPTVENIARVIFQRLAPAMHPVELVGVRVWETAKTSAECTDAEK